MSRAMTATRAARRTRRTTPPIAFVQDLLTLSGVLSVGGDSTVVVGRLALWTPWFAVGGALFTLTALAHRRRTGSAPPTVTG